MAWEGGERDGAGGRRAGGTTWEGGERDGWEGGEQGTRSAREATMAWAAGQSGVGPSARRSDGQMECGGSQPVLRCPDHPHRRVALLTSKTHRNKGRRFYRCMHGYKT
ncbi:hypothetical protein ACP4OV_027902 [Aristida adscensionis]